MFEIRDVRQIRLLASPVRLGIVDALECSGPQSAAALAAILGYAPDGLYHHLRKLLCGGLITAQRRPGGRGKRCAVFALKAKGTRLHYEPSSRHNRKAVTAVAGALLRDASRSFSKAMGENPVVKGSRRNLWVGRRTAWLSQTELEQLNGLLHEIVKLLERATPRRGRTKLYAFTFALSLFGIRTRG